MVPRVPSKRTNRLFEMSKGAHVVDRMSILNGTAKTDVIFRVLKTTTFKDHA